MAHILVIDDDEGVRSVVTQMLEAAGHAVSLAVDGEHGLAQFRADAHDLVLCDVFMPKKSGIATLKELRRLRPGVRVIVMSGGTPSHVATETSAVDLRDLARLLGATDTIAKPFRAADLIAMIDRHLQEG